MPASGQISTVRVEFIEKLSELAYIRKLRRTLKLSVLTKSSLEKVEVIKINYLRTELAQIEIAEVLVALGPVGLSTVWIIPCIPR